MRFKEAYDGWSKSRISQEEALRLLGVSDRTFRRYISRYEEEGIEGLVDKRLSEISHKRAPVDGVPPASLRNFSNTDLLRSFIPVEK